MKVSRITAPLALGIALAFGAATAFDATPAEAGLWDRVKRGAKRLGKRIRRAARDVGSAVKAGAKKARRAIKRGVGKAASVAKGIGKTFVQSAQRVIGAAKKLGRAAAKKALHGPFHAYIVANRRRYRSHGKPLTAAEKRHLAPFFPARLIHKVRVLERSGDTGFFNKSASATTYGNDFVIVRRGRRTNSLLKHELVHVCQYDRYGVRGFAHRYADQYVDGGFKYRNIAFEKQAYGYSSRRTPVSRYLGYCSR